MGVSNETHCINLSLSLSFWLTVTSPLPLYSTSTVPPPRSFREEEVRVTSICTSSYLESNYDKWCTCAAAANKHTQNWQEIHRVHTRECGLSRARAHLCVCGFCGCREKHTHTFSIHMDLWRIWQVVCLAVCKTVSDITSHWHDISNRPLTHHWKKHTRFHCSRL